MPYQIDTMRKLNDVLQKKTAFDMLNVLFQRFPKHNKMAYDQYNAIKAHERFLKRQTHKGKTKILSLNADVKEFVVRQLTEQQWSPQQIAGVLKIRHRKNIISHETIYQFIWLKQGAKVQILPNAPFSNTVAP